MFIAMAVVILLLAIAVHEFSHAVAMRHYGVSIKRAGLGFPVPPMFSVRIPRISFPITFSWTLIGAYVEPTTEGVERMKKLPYRKQAVIYGAGVVANLLMGLVFFALLVLLSSGFTLEEQLARLLIGVVVFVIITRFISIFCSFVIIPLGLALFVFVAFMIIQAIIVDPANAVATGANGNVGGPITIVKMAIGTQTFFDVLLWGWFISLALATTNMLPLSILDGGRIFQAAVKELVGEKAATISMTITSVIFIAFIFFVLAGDIIQG